MPALCGPKVPLISCRGCRTDLAAGVRGPRRPNVPKVLARSLQAVRFALFHLLQAGARAEGGPIPAKGPTGRGYDGHACSDTETFVLPPEMIMTLVSAAGCWEVQGS